MYVYIYSYFSTVEQCRPFRIIASLVANLALLFYPARFLDLDRQVDLNVVTVGILYCSIIEKNSIEYIQGFVYLSDVTNEIRALPIYFFSYNPIPH